MLIATKCDFEEKKVNSEQGLELAQRFNMAFYETSAKSGQNV